MERPALKFTFIFFLLASLQVDVFAQATLDFAADVKARKNLPFVMYNKPCNPPMESLFGNDKLLSLYASSKLISGSMFCRDLQNEVMKSYSPEYCRRVAACADSKNSVAEFKKTDGPQVLRELVTNEYVANELSRNIAEMEKFESMVKFAQKKYGDKLGNLCPSKFQDELNDSICTKRINSVFNETQKNCRIVSTGCHSHDRYGVTSYSKRAEKNSSDTNTFSQYFTELTDVIAKNADENEKAVTDKLISILSTNEPDNKKTENFYKAVMDFEMEHKLDPVLNFYPGNNQLSRKSDMEVRFSKFLTDNLKSKQSPEQLKKKFEDMKLGLSKKIIETTCLATPSYESLCENSVNIYHGKKKAPVDLVMAQRRLKDELTDLLNDKLAPISAKLSSDDIKPNGFKDSQLLLENERCESYDFHVEGLISERPTLSKKLMALPDYTTNVMSSKIIEELTSTTADTKTRIAMARKNSSFSRSSDSIKDEERKSSQENSPSKSIAKIPDAPSQSKNESLIKPVIENKPARTNEPQDMKAQVPKPQNFDFGLPEINQNNLTGKRLNEYQPEVTVKETIHVNDHTEEKIRQINKKLQETNDKVAGEEKRLKEKSKKDVPVQGIDELTAISKDLASLKESLSESSQKKVTANAIPVTTENFPQVSGIDNEDDENESERERKKVSTAAAASSAGGSTYSSTPASSSASVSSGPSAAASSGKSGSSAVVNSPESHSPAASPSTTPIRLVLSAQDGTTTEQREAAILSNILALEGQSFDIIEDGERVKILPLMEKGKLIMNDGKPRFIRIKRNIKNTPESQVRAISSAGDLKKSQEDSLKAEDERLRYIKMKKLSEDLIRKKESTIPKGR